MAYFYRMWVDMDNLEARSEHSMKLIAVLPQAHIGFSSLKIDGSTAPRMVKADVTLEVWIIVILTDHCDPLI